MNDLLKVIKSIVPVDCSSCSHTKVCMYSQQMKTISKELNNVDKSGDSNTPFKITLSCEYKTNNVITPKTATQTSTIKEISAKSAIKEAFKEIMSDSEYLQLLLCNKNNDNISDTKKSVDDHKPDQAQNLRESMTPVKDSFDNAIKHIEKYDPNDPNQKNILSNNDKPVITEKTLSVKSIK